MDAAQLAELLGTPVERVSGLGSSHAWGLHRALLGDGHEVFVKAAADGGQAGVFAAEAAGLRWLGEAAPDLVPEVLAVDEHMLVLPWLPSGRPTPEAAERLGRDLAGLHRAPVDAFGAPWPGYIAELPLDNTEGVDWPRWYAERRLHPYLRMAARYLEAADVRLVEQVIEQIDRLAGPAEPPSRIHGDLWSGNVMWSAGRGVLVDPAAHGGHRETDLAMLALFGAPHLDRVLRAYEESARDGKAPLADGWRDRVPLHQLHPLLVHVALFGSSYRAAMVEAARSALRASA